MKLPGMTLARRWPIGVPVAGMACAVLVALDLWVNPPTSYHWLSGVAVSAGVILNGWVLLRKLGDKADQQKS